jgi:hypothetical protein
MCLAAQDKDWHSFQNFVDCIAVKIDQSRTYGVQSFLEAMPVLSQCLCLSMQTDSNLQILLVIDLFDYFFSQSLRT